MLGGVIIVALDRPDDVVAVARYLSIEREVAIYSHHHQRELLLSLERAEFLIHRPEEVSMRLIADG